ncbi:MAG: hypothetical protein WBQ55_05770 [Xanthobacteraceae bacterium]
MPPAGARRGIARFLVEEYFLTRHLIRGFRSRMSALDTFIRARHYKDRAAEFFDLAGQPFSEEVRTRYLAIADHGARRSRNPHRQTYTQETSRPDALRTREVAARRRYCA